MFSGMIQSLGSVEKMNGTRLLIRCGMSKTKPGDSVSIDGVCLTALDKIQKGRLAFDLSPETLDRTTLGRLRPGDALNLEPALKMGDFLGGHFVSGHVDSVARVLKKRNLQGGFTCLRVEIPPEMKGLIAHKGSIAVNGVSLTISALTNRYFETALIPHTLIRTNLGKLKPGAPVNLEADMLARYVQTCLAAQKK